MFLEGLLLMISGYYSVYTTCCIYRVVPTDDEQ